MKIQHGVDTLENSGQNQNVFSTLNNSKLRFQHPKKFSYTLPAHQKFPLTPSKIFSQRVTERGSERINLWNREISGTPRLGQK